MLDPNAQTGRWLQSVVQGYFNHVAVPGNLDSLALFRERLLGLWWRRLRRRSRRDRLSWNRALVPGLLIALNRDSFALGPHPQS